MAWRAACGHRSPRSCTCAPSHDDRARCGSCSMRAGAKRRHFPNSLKRCATGRICLRVRLLLQSKDPLDEPPATIGAIVSSLKREQGTARLWCRRQGSASPHMPSHTVHRECRPRAANSSSEAINMPLSVAAFQRRALNSARAVRTAIEPADLDFWTLWQSVFDTIRVLRVPDRGLARRDAWLTELLPNHASILMRGSDTAYLSQARARFDLLLISADHLATASRILRDIGHVFAGKRAVVLMTHCRPSRCADLLNRGADDIFHLGMSPEEGRARLAALLRRLRWAGELSRHGVDPIGARTAPAHLEWLHRGNLRPQEFLVLSALHQRAGQVVARGDLLGILGGRDALASDNHLAVLLFRLRRKLRPGIMIETVRGTGVRLTRTTASDGADAPL